MAIIGGTYTPAWGGAEANKYNVTDPKERAQYGAQPGDEIVSYGQNQGIDADVARYNALAGQTIAQRGMSTAGQLYTDAGDKALGQAQGYLAGSDQDAGYQQQGLAELYGMANGSTPSVAAGAANRALDGSIQNQRTAAASSSGGALAQAMGLRQVGQGEAAQRATGALQNQALTAQEQASAQQRYAQAAGQYSAGNVAQSNAATGIASIYGQNAINQANSQAQRNQIDQQNDLYYRGMGQQVQNSGLNAAQKNLDLEEQERQNRRNRANNENAFTSKVLGSVTGMVGSGMGGAMTSMSDERAKDKWGVIGLDEQNARIGQDGLGYIAQNDVPDNRPSLSARFESSAAPKAQAAKPVQAAPRKMTPDELMREADRQIGIINGQRDASLAQGPAVQDQPVMVASYDDEEHPLAYGQPQLGYGRSTQLTYGGRRG